MTKGHTFAAMGVNSSDWQPGPNTLRMADEMLGGLAADVERLSADNARLREALWLIGEDCKNPDGFTYKDTVERVATALDDEGET